MIDPSTYTEILKSFDDVTDEELKECVSETWYIKKSNY